MLCDSFLIIFFFNFLQFYEYFFCIYEGYNLAHAPRPPTSGQAGTGTCRAGSSTGRSRRRRPRSAWSPRRRRAPTGWPARWGRGSGCPRRSRRWAPAAAWRRRRWPRSWRRRCSLLPSLIISYIPLSVAQMMIYNLYLEFIVCF